MLARRPARRCLGGEAALGGGDDDDPDSKYNALPYDHNGALRCVCVCFGARV